MDLTIRKSWQSRGILPTLFVYILINGVNSQNHSVICLINNVVLLNYTDDLVFAQLLPWNMFRNYDAYHNVLFFASAFARSTIRRVASFKGGTVEGITNLTSVGLFLYSSLASSLDR